MAGGVHVLIPGPLQPFAGGQRSVDIPRASTVADALDALAVVAPGVRDRVLDELGRLRPHINIFVGDENIRDASGLATRLPDDCELAILPAVSGG
jgi:molybdopterin converting factor small subunit